jgi:predicted RNase H-like HicB family nuclease
MTPSELTIIYEPADAGWWVAMIPEVPGAFSQGRSQAEARTNVLDALAELMAARLELALRQKQPNALLEKVALGA